MSAPDPVLIPLPFANDAGPSFINTIPDVSGDPQEADYTSGFKPLTFQPVASGGKPPLGQDFNGILYAITTHLYALQGGQLQTYRADVAAAIGGYGIGALVARADGLGYWINLSADNMSDPEAGGAGWVGVYAYGPTAKAVTGGVLTLTAPEGAHEFLVFTGILSGNQQVIVPSIFSHWLVINACTMNGFTLTVKTAAGTGVDIPAGGAASPTAIYCDSVNVQRVFVPSALPTSVTPDPDTIVLRNNLGEAFGVTADLGDESQRLATTEFVNPGSSLTSPGLARLPDGRIEQWGIGLGAGANRTVTFPLAFPNGVLDVQLTVVRASGDALGQAPTLIGSPTLVNFTYAPPDGSSSVRWRALGY